MAELEVGLQPGALLKESDLFTGAGTPEIHAQVARRSEQVAIRREGHPLQFHRTPGSLVDRSEHVERLSAADVEEAGSRW